MSSDVVRWFSLPTITSANKKSVAKSASISINTIGKMRSYFQSWCQSNTNNQYIPITKRYHHNNDDDTNLVYRDDVITTLYFDQTVNSQQRNHSRDNLLKINFSKLFLLILLVINQNVSLVLSDANLNANSNKYFNELNETNPNGLNESYALPQSSRHSVYKEHEIIVDDDIVRDNHFTSTWAVHVPGGDMEANRVAAEHGFRNLGKVSQYNYQTIKIN